MKSRLISRNIKINGRRTSMRLEEATWEAIDEICVFEDVSLHVLCSAIDECRDNSSRTSAVRAFIITYFHKFAAECGGLTSGRAEDMLAGLSMTG